MTRLVVKLGAVECIACWRRGGTLDVGVRYSVVSHPDGTRCLLPARRAPELLRTGR